MGVENLSVSQSRYDREGDIDGLLVYEAADVNGGRDIRLVWSTEADDQTNHQWVITLSIKLLQTKGGDELVGNSTGISTHTQTFEAQECNMVKPYGDNGRVWWSHNLDVDGLLGDLLGPTHQWMYSSRKYDGIWFYATVRSNWVEGTGIPGQTGSNTATLTFAVNYCPIYTLTQAYYDTGDIFVIEYTTTWTRKNDRFAIETQTSAIGGASTVEGRPLLYNWYYDTIAAIGRIEVPVSYLTEHVAGKEVYLNVRFNANFRPIELYFANAAKTLTVGDNRTCNTPRLTLVRSDANGIVIGTADSGDGDLPPDWVTVKMVGSRYSVDQVRVRCGEQALFRFAPFGQVVSFQAIGSTDSGAVSGPSNVVSTSAAFLPGGIYIDDVDTLNSVRLPLRLTSGDMGPTVESKPVMDTMKLAGRKSPSAYYGTGTQTNVSFSAALLDEDGIDVEGIAEWGDVMVRFPDGRRYCIAPTIRMSRLTPRIISVDISGEEVGG